MNLVLRLLSCVLFLGFCLYSFIDLQNEVTEMRIKLPKLAKELKTTLEENGRLRYEIEQFENPEHLMQLARAPQYSHLKHPLSKEILSITQAAPLVLPATMTEQFAAVKPRLTLAA
ncbi:MAG: hypothetical protein ACHQT8_07305, partial [Chlamydiales bacterium]